MAGLGEPFNPIGSTTLMYPDRDNCGEPGDNQCPTSLIANSTKSNVESQNVSKTSKICYRSRSRSRSSSFNASAAEILLGLFREGAAEEVGLDNYTNEEDPTVRKWCILTEVQNPDSWVSKMLATPELWNNIDDTGRVCHRYLYCILSR